MPRAFNDREKTAIEAKLKARAKELFAANGVARTSVDQLVCAAGIAKGSFYRFYPSKEVLFFELLEEAEARLRAPLLAAPKAAKSRNAFAKSVRIVFENICNEKLIQFMGNEAEYATIIRNVPQELIRAHGKADQEFIKAIIALWNTKSKPPQVETVAARLTLLVLVSVNANFIGANLFSKSAEIVVDSLCDCFFN